VRLTLLAIPSALAGQLKLSAGRRQRRRWVGPGRAHIEVKGAHRPENAAFVGRLERALVELDGVHWAEVNAVLGRVVVAFDDERVDVSDLVELIEGVEEAHDLAGERFPHERPEHPADVEPLQRQVYALGADVVGLGLGLIGRVVRASPLSVELASLVSLVDATPALRRPLESWLGHATADLGLAVGNAVAQGLAHGPLGLVVDGVYRGLLFDEIRARRDIWFRREPELLTGRGGEPMRALPDFPRRVPLPSGPVERYADRAAVAALSGAVAAAAITRDPRMAVTATVTVTPKAARLGREGFAARLGRDLARAGIVPMDQQVLRRLDRIDTVVLDSDVLTTGRWVLGSVWVAPEDQASAERIWLAARDLFDVSDPAAVRQRDGWVLEPLRRALRGPARKAALELRGRGRRLLGLSREGALMGLVVAQPELDPLTEPLVASARSVGSVLVAGGGGGLAERLHADGAVAGGTRLAAAVRALQAEGCAVAVVSARQHAALAAADVGIGVARDVRPPWGAHLVTGAGLDDACRILQAVPVARATSRRAALFAAYGSGAGGLLALAGPRVGATSRALVAVNGAALASLAAGAWSAMQLARRPVPLAADTTDWHAMAAGEVLDRTGSSAQGLDDAEVARRQAMQPADAEQDQPGVVRASLEELANPLTPMLASGAGMSAAGGSISDAALIGTVLLANAFIGGVQRVGADHALRRLIDDSAVRVRVRRGSTEALTTADRLVQGDVVTVQAGDAVPADCRILEVNGLEVDESSLTGESQLVAKSAHSTVAASVADRRSMLYTGTAVAAGAASAVVVAVGPATEVGRAAQAGQPDHRPGGVQARLRRLTKVSVPVALSACAAVIGSGLLRGRPFSDSLGTGVSLAVAAVPEGLPLVATVAQLATARRLSRRGVLVRNPGTLEALGRVDVLCFDKTGTLTEGRIRLHRVSADGADQPVSALDDYGRFVLAAALRASPEHRDGQTLPHPTDRAVVDAAAGAGVEVGVGLGSWRLVAELPFEPARGYHAVLGQTSRGHRLAVKGAPEIVLPRCTHRQSVAGRTALDEPALRAVHDEVDRLARHGYRVLAAAERDCSGRPDLHDGRIERLRFVGLLAFADPVRAAAAEAVRGLRAGGVEVIMITGDHPSTAEAIASELDLLDGKGVVTGPDLDMLGDPDLDKLLAEATVFARVSPAHKVRIVAGLQRCGHVVAVTGDGANDAPAIRLADVGVALGLRGTNAAKEAADVVVTDDRLETIIDAVVEGRAMWASVRDAIAVLLGGNLGEIAFTVGPALLLRGGSPLNARQLLLVNLLTDVLPAMALAVRPPTSRTPETLLHEGPDASLGASLSRDIVVRAALTAGAATAAWVGGRVTGLTPARASTVALIGLVGAQLGQTLVAGWRSPLVIGASVVSAAALAGIVQTPGVSQFFGCQPLGPTGWAIGLAATGAASLGAPAISFLLPPPAEQKKPKPGGGGAEPAVLQATSPDGHLPGPRTVADAQGADRMRLSSGPRGVSDRTRERPPTTKIARVTVPAIAERRGRQTAPTQR
jgi:cation-transporting ATPase I